MANFTIPKGLFFEKSKHEAKKIWEGVEQTLEALVQCDPYNGHFFYALMFLKQETDGTQNRHAYLQCRVVRPPACPDTGLFRIIPKEGRYELLYYLPAQEQMEAFKNGGAFADAHIAGWISAYENNQLSDETDHDFSQSELFQILCGKPFGKSKEEMDAALKKFDDRVKKKDGFKKIK